MNMTQLSKDTYVSIKFAILIGCLLGAFFTVITQKLYFHQKLKLIIILIIISFGLFLYLDSIYYDCDFFIYFLNYIQNISNYYENFYNLINNHYIWGILIFTSLNLLFFFLISFPIASILEKHFKKNNDLSSYPVEYQTQSSFLRMIIFVIDFYLLPLVYAEIIELNIQGLFVDDNVTLRFMGNVIKVYCTSGVIDYITYRCRLDFTKHSK